jgi:UDP-N-acetylmuramate: L-alanyl-gamma-D-glutamyl-meso-diaminopimelate ligase
MFNLLNCLAVIIAADAWGVSRERIKDALASFKNVKRRAEVRGEQKGVLVIDDFAHHPTAVRETLRALRSRYGERRLVAIFEPRSWSSRLAVFQQDYAEAFAAAARHNYDVAIFNIRFGFHYFLTASIMG